MKHYVVVYGTLRKPISRYGFDVEYVREGINLNGYKLHVSGLPRLEYTGNPDDYVVVDLLKCDSKNKDSIDRMEIGAGYTVSSVIVEDDEGKLVPASIYLCENLDGKVVHDFARMILNDSNETKEKSYA